LEEKLAMFAECGIEFAFVANFSALRDTEAATFIQDVLKDTCHAKAVVCGFNFRFGKDGSGQAAMLEQAFGQDNFEMLPPYELSDTEGHLHTLVSSSKIRAALMQGDVAKARHMLGRPYQLTAPVVRGKQLGRALGIPTINQFAPPDKLLPASGIYVTRVSINGTDYRGVSNIGVHPTVDADAALNCETHIIGYTGNAYGQSATIEFLERLRDEQRFSSLEVLRQAISEDIRHAIEYFDRHFQN
jgi:riboflavin kinase/FMN adenylyltransferase